MKPYDDDRSRSATHNIANNKVRKFVGHKSIYNPARPTLFSLFGHLQENHTVYTHTHIYIHLYIPN